LSPSNKLPGDGRVKYLRKQEELMAGKINLVEIDLLLTGTWTVAIPPEAVPADRRTLYRAVVRRASKLLHAEYYPIALASPLPTMKIPLREHDQDVPLNLQTLLDQCYAKGGYDDDIDYAQDLVPPLSPADAKWIDHLLCEAGRRTGRRQRKKRR
jgi:hypothetical protein